MLDAPTDVIGASVVAEVKNHIFFAKASTITFTAPYTDNDFSAANGSGAIDVGGTITALAVFREQLIIFTETSIHKLTGNTIADFTLQPITTDIGCIDSDTVQEIAGDIMFLGPDGLRLLSGTDRIGDFGLASVSKTIQNTMTSFVSANTSFTSCVIREKSQYRILGFNTNITKENAQGILATQFAPQGGEGMAWAETRGIKANVAGSSIPTTIATPHLPMDDPRIRKTFYKLFLYTDPQGSVQFTVSLKLDFDSQGSIQPAPISIQNTQGVVGFFGTGTFGTTKFGTKLLKLFQTQVIGSGFTVSFQFESNDSNPPYSIDALTIEYGSHDRR